MAKLATTYAQQGVCNPLTACQEETALVLIGEILEITDTIDQVIGSTKDHIIGSVPEPCCQTECPPDGLLSALRRERAKLNEVLATAQTVRDSIY